MKNSTHTNKLVFFITFYTLLVGRLVYLLFSYFLNTFRPIIHIVFGIQFRETFLFNSLAHFFQSLDVSLLNTSVRIGGNIKKKIAVHKRTLLEQVPYFL